MFHDTVWREHVDGTAGSSVKNEVIGEVSEVRQLESAEPPTVWIRDTSPVGEPVGSNVPSNQRIRIVCENSELHHAREKRRAHYFHSPRSQ